MEPFPYAYIRVALFIRAGMLQKEISETIQQTKLLERKITLFFSFVHSSLSGFFSLLLTLVILNSNLPVSISQDELKDLALDGFSETS